MDRDGTKKGFDLFLTKKISSNVTVPIIASGGVGDLKDFVDGFKDLTEKYQLGNPLEASTNLGPVVRKFFRMVKI